MAFAKEARFLLLAMLQHHSGFVSAATGSTCFNPYAQQDNTTAALIGLMFSDLNCRLPEVCNGVEDDALCRADFMGPSKCNTNFYDQFNVNEICPAMCRTCVSTTTSTTATTTTTTETTTTTTTVTTVTTITSTTVTTTTATTTTPSCYDQDLCALLVQTYTTSAAKRQFCSYTNTINRALCPVFCDSCPATTTTTAARTTTTLEVDYCYVNSASTHCNDPQWSARHVASPNSLCYCDATCKQTGDCCPDYCGVCEDALKGSSASSCKAKPTTTVTTSTLLSGSSHTGTCKNACTTGFERTTGIPLDPKVPARCWCNPLCRAIGDCCFDFVDQCFTSSTTTSTSTTSITGTTSSSTTSTATQTSTSTTTFISSTSSSASSTSPAPPKECDAMLSDVVFVFDSSRSVSFAKFNAQLSVACDIVRKLDTLSKTTDPSKVFGSGIRVAAITYTDTATRSFDFLEHATTDSICNAMKSIQYTPADFTFMHTAIEAVSALFADTQTGYRGSIYNVPSELVMFVDSDSQSPKKIFQEIAALGALNMDSLYRSVVTLSPPASLSATENVVHNMILAGIKGTNGQIEKCASANCFANTDTIVETISTGIRARAPCASGCVPRANIMFLIDSSSSIEEPEAGGKVGGYRALLDVVANTVGKLAKEIGQGDVQVGAMTFSTDVNLRVPLGAQGAAQTMQAVREFPFDHTLLDGGITDTNLHKAISMVNEMDALAQPKGVSQFVVVLTDGVMRNAAGDASVLLGSALAGMNPTVRRIAMSTGARSNNTTLAKIAGRGGFVGDIANDADVSVTIAGQIIDAAGQCLVKDSSRTTLTTATTHGSTDAPVTTTTLESTEQVCQALRVDSPSIEQANLGCSTFVQALGCSNNFVRALCADACNACAPDCQTFADTLHRCLRCNNGKYLQENECVDTCKQGLFAVQDTDDSVYGRACLPAGALCDDTSTTQQCKPPQSLGKCAVSKVRADGSSVCTTCQDGKFLIEGKCFPNLRCKGQWLERPSTPTSERPKSERCNCHASTPDEDNNANKIVNTARDCFRCEITATTSTKTFPLLAGAPSWATRMYHPQSTAHLQCK